MRIAYRTAWSILMAATLLAVVAGCRSTPTDVHGNDATDQSLYERLGGDQAMWSVVDDLVPRLLNDKEVHFARNGWEPNSTNIARLKSGLVAFMTGATGGPTLYHGPSMEQVHANMQITGRQWDAFIEDLKATLTQLEIPQTLQDELISVVTSTRKDIVTK